MASEPVAEDAEKAAAAEGPTNGMDGVLHEAATDTPKAPEPEQQEDGQDVQQVRDSGGDNVVDVDVQVPNGEGDEIVDLDAEAAALRWVHVQGLPESAKGWQWFKRYSEICNVKSASFFGLRRGEQRWAICEVATAEEATALVKELDGTTLMGCDKPVSAKAVVQEESETILKRAKEESRGHSGDRSRSRSRSHGQRGNRERGNS